MANTLSSGARGAGYASSDEHLRDELHRIEGLIRAALLRFKGSCPEDQRERFWHLPDAQIDALANDENRSLETRFQATGDIIGILDWVNRRRDEIDARVRTTSGVELRLARFEKEYGLSVLERDAFLLALLPALHSTYRRTYGVLQLDPARAYGSIAFLAELLAQRASDLNSTLEILSAGSTLVRHRLVSLAKTEEEPFGSRVVSVDERIVQWLTGGDAVDGRLAGAAHWFDEAVSLDRLPVPDEVRNRLRALGDLCAVIRDEESRLRMEFLGPDSGLAVRAAATVAARVDRRLLVIDGALALATGTPWLVAVDIALREARLTKALPIFTHLPAADDADGQARLQILLDRVADFPHGVAIEAEGPTGEGGRTAAGWLTFRLPLPGVPLRQAIWSEHLAVEILNDNPTLSADLAAAFQLTDSQIREAVAAAATLARYRDIFQVKVKPDDFYEACRRLSAARLVAFAQRIEPRAKLTIQTDIVLPPANKRALIELRHRIRKHTRVHGALGLGPHMRLGRGVIALFVGGSGTGKTIAAEILASEQHVDLYRVDLAALSSKWVGETERNLSKVFADAERANCMLFFDEADSVFSRRAEVREARDRWANLETNYVLQRIEEYSGVVILATNFRQNLDEAFQRRIHVVVDFPVPDAASRRLLWKRLLPASPHLSIDDADLEDLASRFELTGGNIRNIVLDACFRALPADETDQTQVTTVNLRHVIASIAREYQKTSRPVTEGDFGRHYEWAMRDVVMPEPSSVVTEV